MKYPEIFESLWKRYIADNKQAQKIHELLKAEGEVIVNDHIALRTFDDPRVCISVLAQPFLNNGYVENGEYEFFNKHLYAKSYIHTQDPEAPKVFISQLLMDELSSFAQRLVERCIDHIPEDLLSPEKLLFAGTPWAPVSYDMYQKLLNESEYCAWMYVHGYRANHFTINVNRLKKYQDLKTLNTFLKKKGFKLNTAGGEIKGTSKELLEQSSTLAYEVSVDFREGSYQVPCCYYEFAKRYPDASGRLYEGFIAASADKIFESTHTQR